MARVRLPTVLLVAAAAFVVAAGGGCKSRHDEIVLGAYLSLSGPDTTFGTDTREGIDLALDEVNAKGGIKGKKVKVLYEDDRCSTNEATSKVQQLIDRDHAVAILGEVASSRSLAGGLVCNKKHVPMITPSSTAVDVTRGRDWVFRVCFTNDQEGDVAARFIHDTLKKNDVAVFYVAQDTYSSGLAQAFRTSFQKLGGHVVIDKGYQKGETNFSTYLSDIEAAHPDVIYTPVYYNDMVQIARQAHEAGIPGTTFVGGDAWDSQNLLDGAGDLLEGAYFTDLYAPDVPWPSSRAFLTGYTKKYGHAPSSMAAQGYDAARLLFDAIARAPQAKPEDIKNAIAATKNFQGATGTLTIDKQHDANKPIVVVRIKKKKFTYATQLSSAAE